ncbi:MAG TPA: uroporphyrinogen-III C-methyltransferase [Actinomycetota bacterium]|nr:uroporphyrinogen-III C-methyltransferase [Actinomycetota bacterium]
MTAFAYPISLDVTGRRCVVIGSGALAREKVEGLRDAGADVVALGTYRPGCLAGAFVAVVTDPDPALHAAVAEEARAERVLLNCVDDVEHCDFAAPSVVRRGDLRIALSTGGKAPALAKRLRLRLSKDVDDAYGELVDLLGEVRAETIGTRGDFETWRRRWQHALDQPLLELVREGRVDEAKELVRRCLTQDPGPRPRTRRAPERARRWVGGGVSIVGAGPGDPDLITVRGRALLDACDVVVYDRLVHPDLVAGKRAIYVGKQSGRHCVTQAQIEELLVRLARAGDHVVRLKGGDPFVFGRGAEEARALATAGVPFEVVPAPTSAVAAPAYAGIPVTDRGVASSVAFVTGSTASGPEPDWRGLATSVDTLVILMPGRELPHVVDELLAGGRDASTLAAVVENGTLDDERVVDTTLRDLPAAVERARVTSPYLVVVGDVVAARAALAAAPATEAAAR